MPFASLREFLARLESHGRLARVTVPVSAALEITEVQTRLLRDEGPAVVRGLTFGHFAAEREPTAHLSIWH